MLLHVQVHTPACLCQPGELSWCKLFSKGTQQHSSTFSIRTKARFQCMLVRYRTEHKN